MKLGITKHYAYVSFLMTVFASSDVAFLLYLSKYCLHLVMNSYYWQGKEVAMRFVSLSSSEIGVERGPASFSDGYVWQVNTKTVATATSIQER